ncbi:VanZ family protein [uncultured Ruminococcus sp.]|uniref:VanZ family protein n=1 Tax=uncultured Ruminococcus sp. TaxID=165186 RepID=UPI0025F9A508|nr:VanZ family protein [uncultured Ruminococcus sp.]
MKMSQSSMRFRVIVFILTIGMIAFAFIHSSMPANLSSEESESVMSVLQYILNFLGFSAELTDHIVRKAAHFAEYTAIGILLVSCAYSFSRTRPHRYYSQILFAGLATAVIDETIQLNVEGRSGQITDVLLDFSGVITGAVFMLLIYMIYRKIRKIK